MGTRSSDPRTSLLEEDASRARLLSRLFGVDTAPPRIARFALLERVGEGAMGTVWSAYDPQLDRRVAIKLLHATTDGGHADERVLREARMMASVNHPNVAQVYEVGDHGGRIWIAMEFVQGPTLREWLRQRERSSTEILAMYAQAARGLAAAHRAGLVHRDFKPDNALVGAEGRVRVVDFGLACSDHAMRVTERDPVSRGAAQSSGGHALATSTGTRAGTPAGTPAYMAPEQLRGRAIDARADQFSLCVALFEALSGVRPFDAASVHEILERTEREPVPIHRLPSQVPGWVRQALARGLRPDPAERYPAIDDLVSVLARDASRRRRRVVIAAGLCTALLSAGVVGRSLAGSPADPCPDPSAQLSGIWDPAVRDDIELAMAKASPELGATTFARVHDLLEAYASAWTAGYRDACEATHVRHVQSDRMLDARAQCLEDRRVALDALAQTLAEADATVVEHAIRAAASLPDVARCSDGRYVLATVPPPEDPEVARTVAAELAEVARARTLVDAGRAAAAKGVSASALERARSIGHAPLTARAEHAHGAALAGLADVSDGERHLVEAYRLSREVADAETAGWSAASVAYLLARHTTRRDEAKTWATVAAVEGAVVGDVRIEAAARNAFGIAAMLSEDREAAGAAFEEAVELLESDASPARLTYRSNLARHARHAGRIEEAAEMHAAIVRDAERMLGEGHPALIGYIDALAETWDILERSTELEPLLERALHLALEARGESHPDTARILSSLGRCEHRLGKLDEARHHLERALAAGEAARARGAEQGAMGLGTLAAVYFDLDEPEQAIVLLRRGVEEQERFMGPESRDAAVARGELATGLLRAGHSEEALLEIEHATAIFEQVLGPDHLDVSQALQVRADARAAAGRDAEAVLDLERALTIRGAFFAPDSPKLADLRLSLAEVRSRRGEHALAIEAAERALHAMKTHGAFPAQEVADAKLVLARALVDAERDRARALGLAREAVATLRGGHPAAQRRARDVEAWIAGLEPAASPR